MLKGKAGVAGAATPTDTDRPRKKLSFREPEIMGCYMQMRKDNAMALTRKSKTLPRSTSVGGDPTTPPRRNLAVGVSCEDLDLESQAMRIVRTVGQAFEVCHKLSITGPSPEDEERDALMADVDAAGSERDSEIISDKQRKDTLSDPLSCDTLAADDTASLHDAHSETALTTSTPLPQAQGQAQAQPTQAQRPLRLDILPPPPNNSTRRSPMSGGETYTSPMTEPLRHTSDALPTAGTPLSSHHEMQLLREQLEQQAQQTQAAVAQVHLLRDQLAAETAARLEAQARTHQLLVHNKELLDHITALVAHLQDQERLHQRQHNQGQNQHGVTMMPQQMSILCDPQTPSMAPAYLPDFQEIDALSQMIQHQQQAPLIENRSSYLPPLPGSPQQRQSMLQHQNSTPGIFTFGFPTTPEQQFQQQLLQRLQTLGGYPAPGRPQSQFNMFQSPNATISSLYQPQLQQQQLSHQHQQQPQQQQQQQMQNISPTQVGLRVSQASSYSGSPVLTRPLNTSMADSNHGDSNDEPVQFIRPLSQNFDSRVGGDDGDTYLMFDSLGSSSKQRVQNQTETSPTATSKLQSQQLAAALSSMGSLRVSGHPEEGAAVVGRRGGGLSNGPPYVGAITRSTSEKVPNRSELMSQVQRTAWARHTTK